MQPQNLLLLLWMAGQHGRHSEGWEVRSANPHLSDRLITPRPSSGGAASGPLSAMDESHKLKDFMRGLVSLFLRAASGEDIRGLLEEVRAMDFGKAALLPILNKELLTAVIEQLALDFDSLTAGQQRGFLPHPRVLLAGLKGKVDPQHVRSAVAFFQSAELRSALIKHGCLKEAVVMRTIYEGFEALTARNLPLPEREERLWLRSLLLLRILGNRLFLPRRIGRSICGLSTKLMVSWIGNADSFNLLLQRLPVEVKLVLDVQRLDEYGCETYFSLLSNICGERKPNKRVLLGVGRKINYAALMQRLLPSKRMFSLASARGNAVCPIREEEDGGEGEGEGLTSGPNDGTYWKRWTKRAKKVAKAATTAAAAALGKKQSAIRSFHKR